VVRGGRAAPRPPPRPPAGSRHHDERAGHGGSDATATKNPGEARASPGTSDTNGRHAQSGINAKVHTEPPCGTFLSAWRAMFQ
jgi:hypothetical protein